MVKLNKRTIPALEKAMQEYLVAHEEEKAAKNKKERLRKAILEKMAEHSIKVYFGKDPGDENKVIKAEEVESVRSVVDKDTAKALLPAEQYKLIFETKTNVVTQLSVRSVERLTAEKAVEG